MSDEKDLTQKIADGFTKKMKALKRLETVHVDNDVWKKTEKKPEIVDLWHQAQKARNTHHNDVIPFPFSEVGQRGIDFFNWGAAPTMGKIVRKRLDDLGVKYVSDEDE